MNLIIMRPVTLIYCLRNNMVLLGMKKRGFGKDKLNGYGGKVHEEESIVAGAARELLEEANIRSKENDFVKVAEIDFFFPEVPKEKDWEQTVHVFFLKKWVGEPEETEEMKPEWHDINNLPMDKMWIDDTHWLPLVFQGKKLKASFYFGKDGDSLLKHTIELVDSF